MSSFWCIVFYVRNIILLGSTTKKHYSNAKLNRGDVECCEEHNCSEFKIPRWTENGCEL